MTENNKNRFTDNETDCLIDSSFTDNLTKKIYVIDEWERIIGLCNNLWEQTQRFEKENQRLNTENEQLKTVNTHLKNELSWIRDYAYWKEKDAFNKLWGAYMETCEEYRILVKDNSILKQQRDYLLDVIDEVLPHSGSTTAYNRMQDIGDV